MNFESQKSSILLLGPAQAYLPGGPGHFEGALCEPLRGRSMCRASIRNLSIGPSCIFSGFLVARVL